MTTIRAANNIVFCFCTSFFATFRESLRYTFQTASSMDLNRKAIAQMEKQETTMRDKLKLITQINVYKKMCQALHRTACHSSSLLWAR